jgi:hypothetical protein
MAMSAIGLEILPPLAAIEDLRKQCLYYFRIRLEKRKR